MATTNEAGSTQRSAVVVTRDDLDRTLATVGRYLPSNYVARITDAQIIIEGHDRAGWTLDGYVIPRLASGLIFANEVAGAMP